MAFRNQQFGQGLPSSRPGGLPPQFPPQATRQPSSQNAFSGFGAAGVALSPPPAASNTAPGASESLDPSDFPALGSGLQSSAAPNTSSATSLLSSYASQAGTGILPNSSLGNGSLSSGLPTAASALAGLSAREFSADDFPALGGFGGQQQGQEQASAVAALQHQQHQHRANLLGSMNGVQGAAGLQQRSVSGAAQAFLADADKRPFPSKQSSLSSAGSQQQPWAGTPTSQTFPSSTTPYTNGNTNGLTAASSPLPPSSASQASSQDQQASLRSPSLGSQVGSSGGGAVGAPGSGISNPPGMSLPSRTVGGGAASSALPPASSATVPPSATASLPLPPSSSAAAPGTTTATTTSTTANPQTPAQQVLFSPADRYGLLGLLHIIKSTDPDLNMLALGNDLSTLGLDLSATDPLYSNFITPWSDSKVVETMNIEPEYHLPSCYNVQPPPAGTKIGNFSDETLFMIFYGMPRDAMQEMAAQELYKHNWRYHKELRLWLTKEAGTEPTQKTQSFERGSYIFWDPLSFSRVRKNFVLVFDALERRT